MGGRERARATDIPPRNPPHVSMGIARLVNSFKFERNVIGIATDKNLAASAIGIAAAIAIPIDSLKVIVNTCKPIKRNRIEFHTSSVRDQNLKR